MRHPGLLKGFMCVLVALMFVVPAMALGETHRYSRPLYYQNTETLDAGTSMETKANPVPFGHIIVFGLDVNVIVIIKQPGENSVDIEVLDQPLYIFENGPTVINPGAFVRLYDAYGLFLLSFPICFGICSNYAIIG